MRNICGLFLCLAIFISCNNTSSEEDDSSNLLETTTEIKKTKKPKVDENDTLPKEVVRINKSTKVKSVLTTVKGEKHGVCKQFYPSGTIWKESMYERNRLNGKSKIYYEEGGLQREVNYRKGRKHGKFIEYFKSGNLKTEITYEMGLPLLGYTEINYLKKKIEPAEIKVRHEDRLFESIYNLHFTLDSKFSKVKFYVLENKEDWNSVTDLDYYQMNKLGGKYKLELKIQKGYYYVSKLHVFAVYTTKAKNQVVVYKLVNLALTNDY